MPNRILRDWTDSERVSGLSVYAERFFIRLIMKVDDFGRCSANPKLLRSLLFPLLIDSVCEADVRQWIGECAADDKQLIVIYSVNDKEFLQIENFKQVLRQKREKYPPPPNRIADATQAQSNGIADASLREKRNESETEERHTDLKSDLFSKFKKEGGAKFGADQIKRSFDIFWKKKCVPEIPKEIDSEIATWLIREKPEIIIESRKREQI